MQLDTNRNGLALSRNGLRCFMILQVPGGMSELVEEEWFGDDGQGIKMLLLRSYLSPQVLGCMKPLEMIGCLRMPRKDGCG